MGRDIGKRLGSDERYREETGDIEER